tara:strand:- start:35718 stop:38945 length:3228 start_codon:yes stop_codon:yes gene_type:complete
MALISPGVEVTVIDESNYAPSAAGTVAAIVIATAQDKTSGTGTGIASGTTAANAGSTFLIGSQRELTATFGNPTFYNTAAGSPINGYELNEYGLLAAYSLLGVSNRAYVIRADVDLAQLVSSTSRPLGNPTNGTVWWDVSSDTRWGIFEWNQSTGAFTNKIPTVITTTTDLDGGVPKTSIGAIGDYALVATNTSNPVYYKNRSNAWVLVGSAAWMISHPTISGTVASPRFTQGNTITINGTTVTMLGSTVTELKTSINNASITGVTADVHDNKIEIYANALAVGVDSSADGKIVLANASGSILTDAGLTAGTYARPLIAQDPHYTVPAFKSTDTVPRPSGSVWVKTTSSNLGFLADVSSYSASTALFGSAAAPAYTNDRTALKSLDPTGGGLNIAAGSFYIQYDVSEDDTVTYKLFKRYSSGVLEVTGTATTASLTAGNKFTIQASTANSTTLTTAVEVTLSGTTLTTLATDINGANVANVSASILTTGAILIKHSQGGVIRLKDTSGTPLATAGISTSITTKQVRAGNASDLILSNWIADTYTASTSAPSANPTDLSYWYHGGFEADILIHNGTTWKGYQNITDTRGFALASTSPDGVIFSTAEPTLQSDDTALVNGDLWIDTSDLENYPALYRRQTVSGEAKWVLIDKTDTTTENGIIFGDARFMGDATTDVVTGTIPTTISLLTSDYLDIDRPDPTIYPRGMLLFNTRRSSYGVKQFRSDYLSRTNFSDTSVYPTLPTEKDAWVTASGSSFGRKAARSIIATQMKSALDASTELREDARIFNTIAAPGFPELISNMVSLNNDRRQTAFVIGDSPMRLAATSTAIENYATNTAAASDNNEDGLVTSDPHLAVFYPSATTNDLSGNTVVVPPSHMMLRTLARSDDISFPWFAPAGSRRGLVDNVNSIGFINAATGAFVNDNVRESVRDTLYSNRINPIAFFNGAGILNYGNKTRAASTSALDRINVSRLTGFLRRQMQDIATGFVFEPNDKITRDEIKQQVEQTLNDLVAKRGVFDYLVVCDETNNTADRIDRNELYVDIAIEPTKAAEFIFIPIRLKNTGEISSGNLAATQTI